MKVWNTSQFFRSQMNGDVACGCWSMTYQNYTPLLLTGFSEDTPSF